MTDWWQPAFRTTIDAYYQGNLAAGLAACERLLSVDGLPPDIAQQTRRNLAFYLPKLSALAPSLRAAEITIPVAEGWTRFNPSVAAGPDGLMMIVRSANFQTSPRLEYTINDIENIVRTTNYLVTLSDDLEPGEVRQIDDAAFRPEPPPFPVAGFEDCRLVWHRGAWWASATVRDRAPSGVCQIALFRLDGAAMQELHLLSDGVARHEKNWMPVAGDAETLRFLYASSPTTLLRFDDASGTVTPEITQPAPFIAQHFSGGTRLIPLDGGHLGLVHEGVRFDDGGRVYSHRWLWFDDQWRLARLSPPFMFQERGVEFAAGLAQRGDELVVSYGVWDREAWLATLPLAEVMPLLAPPLDAEATAADMRAQAAPPPLAPVPTPAEALPLLDAEFVPIPKEPTPPGAGITPFAAASPSIASTTLTGNSREIIAAALRSAVDWVDWMLVIDTGVTDDTLDIAREIAGDKLVVRQFPWQADFAAARNFALDAAAALGADWAVTLDTDERLDRGQADPRAALAATAADALHVKQADGTYGKERFFRLPARGRYAGPTHEAFIRDGGFSATLEGVRFSELGKSHEQYRQKAERDIEILTRHTAEHPDDPRWFYYLGDSYAGLGRLEEAIAAFRVCASLHGWDEEGAWAMYRAAESLLKLGKPVEAIEACAVGMSRHAGLGELPWLAAYAAWRAGRPAQAAHWARLSIVLGHFMGHGAAVPRVGFRHPPALWEGPFDVLRYALRATGDDAAAAEAETLFARAQAAREAAGQ